MARAGYDPEESVRFWDRMRQSKQGGASLELLSTHPADEKRIARLREKMPRAMKLYRAAPAQYRTGQRLPLR